MSAFDFFERHAEPGEEVCDFCSSPDVQWSFPCRDHNQKPEQMTALGLARDGSLVADTTIMHGISSGAWTACPACKTLIMRGDRDRLARRSAKRLLRNNPDLPMPFKVALAHVRRLQDQFWENRLGQPVSSPKRKAAQ